MSEALARQALQLFQQRNFSEARPLLEALLDAGNTPLPCIIALAEARERTGDIDGAIILLTNLYSALPQENIAAALAIALLRAGDQTTLDARLPTWLTAYPNNSQLQAVCMHHALKRGDRSTGLQLLSKRWALTYERPMTAELACPIWDGQRFPGLLLVGTEHGLGDIVLWSALLADLARLGQPALVACDARLLPLFRRSFPTLEFADAAQAPLRLLGQDMANRRIQCPDLAPLLWRGDIPPPRTPWLRADPARVIKIREQYRSRFPDQTLIGLSWSSHRDLAGYSKSIPVAELKPLLAQQKLACVSLQYGDIADDLVEWQSQGLSPVIDTDIDLTQDIDGVCALICALDGIVSCSTTVAHLAGALGANIQLLAPGKHYVLWYWGYESDSTPWYPTMRILRGPPRTTWEHVARTAAASFVSSS